MVPVGGAVIAGFDAQLIKKVAESYPGKWTPSRLKNSDDAFWFRASFRHAIYGRRYHSTVHGRDRLSKLAEGAGRQLQAFASVHGGLLETAWRKNADDQEEPDIDG